MKYRIECFLLYCNITVLKMLLKARRPYDVDKRWIPLADTMEDSYGWVILNYLCSHVDKSVRYVQIPVVGKSFEHRDIWTFALFKLVQILLTFCYHLHSPNWIFKNIC